MKRLFIAEKPSLAQAIAAELPKPHRKEANCIRCGTDDVVTWAVGHVMELAPPDAYGPEYKKWTLEKLPIIPTHWQHRITKPKVFNAIKLLMAQAKVIVNAGDPDKEGQLLIDEIINRVGTTAPVKRILVSDMNSAAVRKALSNIKNNSDFKTTYDAAFARQCADWMYGMNLTRLYTLLGKKGGYNDVLTVGRVQTPLLGLIVRRDSDISKFLSKAFYVIAANVGIGRGSFTATWKPSAVTATFLDKDGRLTDSVYAKKIVAKLKGATGVITKIEKKEIKENPPLPFSLVTLQMQAAERLNYDADKTLKIVQSLYETHKLTTYPRSDCKYLPEGHLSDIPRVISAIKNNTDLDSIIDGTDLSIISPAWDSKKTGAHAHHAIIPTPVSLRGKELSKQEKIVYDMICERYIMQFYPEYVYEKTNVTVSVSDETLYASGKTDRTLGWKVLFKKGDEDGGEPNADVFPEMAENQKISIIACKSIKKKTNPPKHFTTTTLLAAMSGIARYVTDPKIKRLLSDADGIGTTATQAAIIKTLFDRKYTIKKGRKIVATDIGKALINALPNSAVSPDMTAFWELALSRIISGKIKLNDFLSETQSQVTALVNSGRRLEKIILPIQDKDGRSKSTLRQPIFHNVSPGDVCPVCKQGEVRVKKIKDGPNKNMPFLVCSTFKCKFFQWRNQHVETTR